MCKDCLNNTIKEFVKEFAELNLEVAQHAKTLQVANINPELLKELRQNAQALITLSANVYHQPVREQACTPDGNFD